MSWWMFAIAIFVLVRIARARGCQRAPLGLRHGRHFDIGAAQSLPWRQRLERGHATSSPPVPSAPDPRRDLQRTIETVRQEYVAGRIEVAEYERKLDELYRTAEGKRLVQGS